MGKVVVKILGEGSSQRIEIEIEDVITVEELLLRLNLVPRSNISTVPVFLNGENITFLDGLKTKVASGEITVALRGPPIGG